MTIEITDAQIEKLKNTYDEMMVDSEWVARNKKRDQKRLVVQAEILELFSRFQQDQISLESMKETFDRKTRKDWDVFGFKGLSGAMFLNKLVIHIPDQEKLTDELKHVFMLPVDETQGHRQLVRFQEYLEETITDGSVTRRAIQPARAPFLVSGIWHLQDLNAWPVYYISGRRVLTQEGIFEPTNEPVEDYFTYRSRFLQLAEVLELGPWDLEHVLARYDEQKHDKPKATRLEPTGYPSIVNDDEVEDAEFGDENTHTHIQGLLAKIGRKLNCKVWIAANDKRKRWGELSLGDLSIDNLPPLGLDPETQRIISLIDVLWIKGHNQVVAAFEVEHTTSVYSGLLRMSDLVASAPNQNFQLYIVAPEERISKVRQQLSRPTFQMLELHKQCGFFSFEALTKEADAILRWATDTVSIEKLAEKVDDVFLEF